MECPFCGNSNIIEFVNIRRFLYCSVSGEQGCGGFFVHKESFDCESKQRERYLLHSNELGPRSDANGYRAYLNKFLETVFSYERETQGAFNIKKLFDYGSGPYPALVELLNEQNQKFAFVDDVKIKHWDPFFYPSGTFFEGGADIVFCLEVVEHFEKPQEGFDGLAKAAAKNGLIAIKTQIAPQSIDEFNKWWYKEDSTHVSFYSHISIEECAKKAGLLFEAEKDKVIFLRKQ